MNEQENKSDAGMSTPSVKHPTSSTAHNDAELDADRETEMQQWLESLSENELLDWHARICGCDKFGHKVDPSTIEDDAHQKGAAQAEAGRIQA